MKATRRMLSAALALLFLCTSALGEALIPTEALIPVEDLAPEEISLAEPAETAQEVLTDEPTEAEPTAESIPAEPTAEPVPNESIPAEPAPDEHPVVEAPVADVPPAGDAPAVEAHPIVAEAPAGEEPELAEESIAAVPFDAAGDFTIEGTTLTKYSGSDPDVVIPASVQTIGYGAFRDCTTIRSLTIPGSVRTVEGWAFEDCTNLQTVTFEGGSETLVFEGYGCFYNCPIQSLTVNRNFETTGESGLFDNGSRSSDHFLSVVTLSSDVTFLCDGAFSGCSELNSIDIPESVTRIGKYAFSSCCFEEVKLPSGLTAIEDGAFSGCSELNSIDIPESVTRIGKNAFSDCDSIWNIKLPSGLTAIEDGAFQSCGNLRTIDIPSGVTRIGADAFVDCSSLWKVDLPAGLTEIGDGAFSGCSELEQIALPRRLARIGNSAFYWCNALPSLALPDALSSIGKDAFRGCGVTSFAVPSGITEISDGAFASGHLQSISLPATLTRIGPNAFEGSGLTSIELPKCITSIGSRAFAESSLRSFTFPKGVATIESELFSGCANLSRFTVPGHISEIKSYAFQGCKNMTAAVLEEGVAKLGSGAFKDCGYLRTVRLPESLTSIDRYAFQNCGNLLALVRAGSQAETYCEQNDIPYSTGSIGTIEFTGVKDGDAVPRGEYTLRWKAVSGANLYVAGSRLLGEGFGADDWDIAEFEELSAASYTFYTYDTDVEVWVGAYKTSGSARTLLADGTIKLRGDANLSSVSFPSSLRLGVGESQTITASSNQDSKFTYASSDKKIATISAAGLVKALKAGTATLTAKGNRSGNTARCVLTVYAVPTKVSLSPAKLTIGVGQQLQLAPTVTPEGAETELSYSSDNSAIASVDADGTVTGAGTGSTTLRVQTSNGKKANCSITVQPAPSAVSFDPAEIKITEGRSVALKPALTPANAAASFRYESDDDAVARVDEDGTLEAVGEGSATITATAQNGVHGSVSVRVLAAPKEIEIPTEIELGKGEKRTLTPAAGENTDIIYSYASSKTSVATVSAGGKITARKAGEAVITVTADTGATATCRVSVEAAPSKVTLSEKKATLGVNDKLALEATLPAGSASALNWTSSKSAVASVDEQGNVTALTPGSTTVSAKTFNGKEASCKITVKAAPASVTFAPANLKLASGQEYQLKPALDPGAAASFTYESNDEAVASVDENGLLTAGKPGTARITARTHNGLSAECEITVVAAPATLSIADITLGKGEKLALQPKVDSGADSDVSPFTYAVKKASIAKLTSDEQISGKAAGSTTLTVTTYNGLKATCDVTVTKAPASVSFSIKSATMSPGCKLKLDAVLNGETASKLSYESDNEAAATVAPDGTVTAIAPGTATITVKTYNGKKASFTVIVE